MPLCCFKCIRPGKQEQQEQLSKDDHAGYRYADLFEPYFFFAETV